MRGRVMSLWAIVFLGSTAIGAPLIGFLAGHYGARFALGVGGVATLLVAIWAGFELRRIRNHRRTAVEDAAPTAAESSAGTPGENSGSRNTSSMASVRLTYRRRAPVGAPAPG